MSDQEWPSAPGSGSGGSTPPPSEPPPSAPPPAAPPPPAAQGSAPPPPSAPPPAPGAYGQPAAGTRNADVGIRLGARIIDAIIVGIVNGIIAAAIIVPLVFSNYDGFANPMFATGLSGVGIIVSLIGLAISLGYYAFFDNSRGATPGKMILNLRVEGRSGNPTFEESIRRNAFLVLGIVPILGGLLQLAAVIYIAITISQDPENRGWHDRFADTRVVRTQ